jgi:type II secretory pathway predicted ATPase ExeA
VNYQRYGLSGNPFREEGPDFLQIDRGVVRRQIATHLSEAVSSHSPHIYVVLGEYGTGKTFTLRKVLGELEAGTFLTPERSDVLSVYIKVTPPKTPSGYALYLYSSVVEGISEAWFAKTVKAERERLGDIGFQSLTAPLPRDLRQAIARFGGPEASRAWAYLSGRKIAKPDLAAIRVESPIVSEQDASRAMLDLLRFLKLVGVASVILFVDEIEYIVSSGSSGRVAQVLTTFKELYDRTNEELIAGRPLTPLQFVFASTPSAWDDLIPKVVLKSSPPPANAALWERVDFRFDLQPFLLDDTRDLIKDRLAKRRVSAVTDPLTPFERGVVPMIHRLAEGIPRRIIRICALALQEAAERDFEGVDEKILQRAYESYPWAREMGEAGTLGT